MSRLSRYTGSRVYLDERTRSDNEGRTGIEVRLAERLPGEPDGEGLHAITGCGRTRSRSYGGSLPLVRTSTL